MEKCLQDIATAIKTSGFKLRPDAGSGIWVAMLLPSCIIITMLKLPAESTAIYKQNAIASVGLILVNFILFYTMVKHKKLQVPLIISASSITIAFLFWICLKKSIFYSILSGFGVTLSYAYLLPFCLHIFPLAFTFGEAALCTQATVLFIFSSAVSFYNIIESCKPPHTNSGIVTAIIQVGILGIFLILTLLNSFKKLQTSFGFYLVIILVVTFGIFPLLHFLLDGSPVLWLLMFIFSTLSRFYIILYWAVCVLLAILFMSLQVRKGNHASTSLRKIFHILAAMIFLPGLLYECTLLYIATGIIFALFIMMEIARKLNVAPFGKFLQMGFQTYVDEKDAGEIALTPIYLLTGCSLPIWLHPCPCDLTDSAGLQILVLLSGILSIGIGDTMASVVGSNFGKHKWKGSKKTIEGTFASIVFQMLTVGCLICAGIIHSNPMILLKSTFAITANALVEAKTDQVDNLILPIITYMLLI